MNCRGLVHTFGLPLRCSPLGLPRVALALLATLAVVCGVDVSAADKLYWTNTTAGTIQRANLDGSDIEDVASNLNGPATLALDPICRRIYFNTYSNEAQRAGLDGSEQMGLFPTRVTAPMVVDPIASYLYVGDGAIVRSSLDGSARLTLLAPGGLVQGIALDTLNNQIYWTTVLPNAIRRANLDGSGAGVLISLPRGEEPWGIALDIAEGKMYWTTGVANSIRRSNLDGTGIEELVVLPNGFFDPIPTAIALDLMGRKMYWTERKQDRIRRANLDGSDIETVVSGVGAYFGIAILPDVPAQASDSSLIISPTQGGDTGSVTVRIMNRFIDGLTIHLLRDEESIPAVAVGEAEDRGGCGVIAATFDLRERTRGAWDLVLDYPDGTTLLLRDAFEIVMGTSPHIHVGFLSTFTARAGRRHSVVVVVSNNGNVDAEVVPLIIGGIPPEVQLDHLFSISSPPPLEGQELIDWNQVPSIADVDDDLTLPLLISRVSPGEIVALEIGLTAPSSVESLQLTLRVGKSFWSDHAIDPDVIDCLIGGLRSFVQLPPGVDCAVAIVDQTTRIYLASTMGDFRFFSLLQFVVQILAHCAEFTGPVGLVVDVALKVVAKILSTGGTIIACARAFPHNALSSLVLEIVTAVDPNNKVGLPGVGEAHFIALDTLMSYSIHFENLDTATAPAQEVTISDHLDSTTMDLDSVTLGPILLGGTTVVPPPGLSQYNSVIDLRPEEDLLVEVSGTLDRESETLQWTFRSLDPATGELPTDPLTGFLPANVSPPEGEGSVLFSIMPQNSLSSGSSFSNQGTIVFDNEPPVPTPIWSNTLDASAPESHVLSLERVQSMETFEVRWEGNDVGSGIEEYAVLVSVDGGQFETFIEDTEQTNALFTGVDGRSYEFLSQATDRVGNHEAFKSIAEASTRIEVTLPVEIDIKPETASNTLNLSSRGVIPVALLTTNPRMGDPVDFDAREVDVASLSFGPAGATVEHREGHVEDVDGDGDLDVIVHFRIQETGISCGDTEATLTGATNAGRAIEGIDKLRTVGCSIRR